MSVWAVGLIWGLPGSPRDSCQSLQSAHSTSSAVRWSHNPQPDSACHRGTDKFDRLPVRDRVCLSFSLHLSLFQGLQTKTVNQKVSLARKKPFPHSEVQRRKSYRLYWDINSWDTDAFSEDIQARFKSRANKWGLILEYQTDNHMVCGSSLVKENTLASQSALLWPRATA